MPIPCQWIGSGEYQTKVTILWGDNVAQNKSTCQNQMYGFYVHIRITKFQKIDTRKTFELKLICYWDLNALNPAGPREELKRSWLACS